MKEFDLIKRYFEQQPVARKDVLLGIGDDCAMLTPQENKCIAVTTDTLVAGVHFPVETLPRAIGHKAVAVNLSDLASMGAEPSWISLALTLPNVDEEWIREFSAGVFELCEYFNVQLIGGDTTQGPLSITITAQGTTPVDRHLSRSTANAGDWIYVTGDVGDAALALRYYHGKVDVESTYRAEIQHKLDYPKPRVLAGHTLRDYASAAIDISDGLLSDLGHLCNASQVGANVVLENIPLSKAMLDSLPKEEAIELALNGGDDYELLFTVSDDNRVGMETALTNAGISVTCIGQLNGSDKITTTLNNKPISINASGFSISPRNKVTQVNRRFNLSDPFQFLALGFGSGLIPKAPGTFGTLAAIPIYLLMTSLSSIVYITITVSVAVLGITICQRAADAVGVHDHPAIVWDEIAGFLITMALVPFSWSNVIIGFLLFRVFDIVKPWPISYLDKNLSGGFGIMADDIAAGLIAMVLLFAINIYVF